MSEPMSWKHKSTSYSEPAIELVRDCVAALRATGTETKNALPDIADVLGISPRRVRCLFYRDGFPIVLKNEWLNIRQKAGLFFMNNADRLRELADKHEARGEDLVSEQQEFVWVERTSCTQKHCA